jgi:hypothetical protein
VDPDIFIPQLGLGGDEVAHELDAHFVLQYRQLHALRAA